MSSRARSFSELWNDPNQDEVLFVLQVIPDKREKVIPGAGIYGVVVVARFQDLGKVQEGKIYVTLDTGQINFLDASNEVCCVTLPPEMDLQSLQGDEKSDSPKRIQTKNAIFNFAREHGYPFNVTQDEIGERYREILRGATEINKANPRLIPVVIPSPNTAIACRDMNVQLAQFDPSIYDKMMAQLLPIQENAGMFRLHFSDKKRDDIIAQTETNIKLWPKTEIDLGLYYFQVTEKNGIEVEDPEKGGYFPLYHIDSKGKYKICERFRQMNLDRIADIKVIGLEKKKRDLNIWSQQPDKYKKVFMDLDRDAALKKIQEMYKNREISLTEKIEARYAEQMRLYIGHFEIIKNSNATVLGKRQQLIGLREEVRAFVSQERSQGIEDLFPSLYDSLDTRAKDLIRDSITPEIERLEVQASTSSSSSLFLMPEPIPQTGRIAQLDGYAKWFQEVTASKASILKKLKQLRKLKEDVLPFMPTASDKSQLEDYDDCLKELMENIRNNIRELRQRFREEIIKKLVLYLEIVKEKGERDVVIKMLIHLRHRADMSLIDATEEENHFMINCPPLYLNALKTDDSFSFLDGVDKKALESDELLTFLMSITVKVPELREVLFIQIIHSNVTVLQKLQRLNRLKSHIRPFEREDNTAREVMASIRVAIDECREKFLNIASIKSLALFLADLGTTDYKSATRITFLGWSAKVPIPSSETEVAEITAIKNNGYEDYDKVKIMGGILPIDLTHPELEIVSENPVLLGKGALLESLTADEQKVLQDDSELQGILKDIVCEVPELQSVLSFAVLQNEYKI